jgi:hypothetical protein
MLLFQARDRDSMLSAFDLFDYADVAKHADTTVGCPRGGQMPCAWPASRSRHPSGGLTWASTPKKP